MRRADLRSRAAGFTLVELSIVILIIGLMTSFLLVVSYEGVRRANERATQTLIMKLDLAVSDRLEAVQTILPPVNNAHRLLAMVVAPADRDADGTVDGDPAYVDSEDRATLIARLDFIRREMPDVFFVQGLDVDYPLNFAGLGFYPQGASAAPLSLLNISPVTASNQVVNAPGVSATLAPYVNHVLPLGNSLRLTWHYQLSTDTAYRLKYKAFTPFDLSTTPPQYAEYLGESQWNRAPVETGLQANYSPAGVGIFGASYQARASFNKQLGYHAAGTNGLDDNGNGLVDELPGEGDGTWAGETDDPITPGLTRAAGIAQRLSVHRHETARSEALYAMLVEGQGPLGSVFRSEDFSSNEIADTDGDGLMEFVDSWGRPLQFFRWPIYFTTEVSGGRSLQIGGESYKDATATRQENPLDANNLLVAPGWWSNQFAAIPNLPPTTAALMSDRARYVHALFFSLLDPYADGGVTIGQHWDRSGIYMRRQYFSRPLILSGGEDTRVGLGLFGVAYDDASYGVLVPGSYSADQLSFLMNVIEGQAARLDPVDRLAVPGSASLFQARGSGGDTDVNALIQENWALDDVHNQTVTSSATGVR